MPLPLAARPSRAVRRRSAHRPTRRWLAWLFAFGLAPTLSAAQTTATPAAPPAATSPLVSRSAMDGVLFYQLLVSELELRQGDAGLAFQVMLEAAKRSREDALFRRAVDIAIGARAGEQALVALKTWRQTTPKSREAAEIETQMLMALGRHQEAREPLTSFIDLTPPEERAGAIASLPRLVLSGEKPEAAAQAIDDALKPWRAKPATRLAALTAAAGAWLTAGNRERPLALLREAHDADRSHQPTALLALELMKDTPQAEVFVTDYLATPTPAAGVRAAYVRRLTAAQRYGEALAEVGKLTTGEPELATGWLMQGALQIELGQPAGAKASLLRFLALKEAAPTPVLTPPIAGQGEDDEMADKPDDEVRAALQRSENQERGQAYLMLSQVAEQLKDYPGALGWLEKLASLSGQADSASVLQRRASLLMRQGQLPQARALLQQMPTATPEDKRTRFMAEAQLLRDAKEWTAAHTLLTQANAQVPDDTDLLYEQALLAEKLLRFDEMETLLQRVIQLKPDQQHAYNALGYSLADRNVRLPEARTLIEKALSFTPGDPFITDSLGWIEFRLGRLPDAVRLLGDAYRQRPDVEIGAHLGEVLWSMGRQDEARKVWREAQGRDTGNEVLAETLKRLKVGL
ncbi:tetratricopeptide repeat protein [Sphaerotilus sp.]|uniref:tetratricopeptide repeat protein n=1 Tax=Sphaerotilus sp. TaxID=2093942 RepID=UPI0025EECE8F|nr:tetratricopeptide repeat protein [Sphaerotilus sp.]